MNSIQLIFADSMGNVFTALSSASLQVWLLVGSGILAVSLLVLALTKWGHSRPVWKCVILSFIAHILLMGYAYATYMILDHPAPLAVNETMQVNLIEEVGEQMELTDSDENQSPLQSEKWDQVADQAIETPELEPLDRPLIDSEVVVEPSPRPARAIADQLTASTSNLTAPKPADNTFRPAALPDASKLNDFSKPDPQSFNMDAQPIKIARRTQESGQSLTDMPDFDNNFQQDLPREQIEPLAAGSSEVTKPKQQITRPKMPANQLRFAGQQPLDDQLANATSNALFRRQTANGSKNGNGQLTVVKRRRRLGDGQPLPEVYSLRDPQERLDVAIKHGGSARTERAVNAAFGWLVTNQQTDGSWSAAKTGAGRETKTFGHDRDGAGRKANTGVTALATLSLLAGGHSHFEGNYRQNVQRALEYLISQQSNDGNLAGDAKLFARMYCHSMSLLALSEALAMTGDQRLMPAVQRGVDYCVKHRIATMVAGDTSRVMAVT